MNAEAPEREDAPMECAATSVSFDDDSKAYQLQSIALLITPLPVLLLTLSHLPDRATPLRGEPPPHRERSLRRRREAVAQAKQKGMWKVFAIRAAAFSWQPARLKHPKLTLVTAIGK